MIRKIHVYVVTVCLAGAAALLGSDWAQLLELSSKSVLGLGALVGVGLISESLAIRISVGKSAGNTSITFIPLLAAVQLFGPPAAVLLMLVTGLFGEFVVRRKEPIRAVFNVAQWTASAFVAGWAFRLFHGVPLESIEAFQRSGLLDQLGPFIGFGLVFLALNHAAVSLAVVLSQGQRFSDVWSQMLGHSGASLNDLLISPLALGVAFLYVQLGLLGILVVLLPMLFIRHSYMNMSRLRDSNADLLKVLVKAIETRDPYTSGHSLRVSRLARRIAEELNLPRVTVERVETAALLHDIGKIDAVFIEILRKPDSLTVDERAVIESHVVLGEDILRTLSSVPDEVALAVRHHHERFDGFGYPDGMRGDDTPIAARIIVICDAIDAMLSDRPYRKALPFAEVLEQLERNRGSQFDPRIVDTLLASNLIVHYAAYLRSPTGWSSAVPGPLPRSFPWTRGREKQRSMKVM